MDSIARLIVDFSGDGISQRVTDYTVLSIYDPIFDLFSTIPNQVDRLQSIFATFDYLTVTDTIFRITYEMNGEPVVPSMQLFTEDTLVAFNDLFRKFLQLVEQARDGYGFGVAISNVPIWGQGIACVHRSISITLHFNVFEYEEFDNLIVDYNNVIITVDGRRLPIRSFVIFHDDDVALIPRLSYEFLDSPFLRDLHDDATETLDPEVGSFTLVANLYVVGQTADIETMFDDIDIINGQFTASSLARQQQSVTVETSTTQRGPTVETSTTQRRGQRRGEYSKGKLTAVPTPSVSDRPFRRERSPVRDTRPFRRDEQSSVRDTRSPVRDTRPYRRDEQSSVRDTRPYRRDDRGPMRDTRPYRRDDRGPIRDTRPYRRDEQSSVRDTRPYRRDDRGPIRDSRPYRRDDRGPIRDSRPYRRDEPSTDRPYRRERSPARDSRPYRRERSPARDSRPYRRDEPSTDRPYRRDDRGPIRDTRSYRRDDRGPVGDNRRDEPSTDRPFRRNEQSSVRDTRSPVRDTRPYRQERSPVRDDSSSQDTGFMYRFGY